MYGFALVRARAEGRRRRLDPQVAGRLACVEAVVALRALITRSQAPSFRDALDQAVRELHERLLANTFAGKHVASTARGTSCLPSTAPTRRADVAPPPRGAPVPDDLRRGRQPPPHARAHRLPHDRLRRRPPAAGERRRPHPRLVEHGYSGQTPRTSMLKAARHAGAVTACRRRQARRRRSPRARPSARRGGADGRAVGPHVSPGFVGEDDDDDPERGSGVGALRRAALRRGERRAPGGAGGR